MSGERGDGVVEPVEGTRPPLFVVDGDATPEEVAALAVVLQSLAAASAVPAQPRPRSEWSSPRRAVRRPHHHAPGAWRAHALPH